MDISESLMAVFKNSPISESDRLIRNLSFKIKAAIQRAGLGISFNSQQDLNHESVSEISSGVPSSARFQSQSPFYNPPQSTDCIQDLQKQTSLSLENHEDFIEYIYSKYAGLLQCVHALSEIQNTLTSSQMQRNDEVNDDQKLESEIVEVLKSRGNSISIASLPEAYQEKYGKVLQADGYLTESQRHGRSGYNLARLLLKFRNSIRLIDRPHGQHVVVLAEDAWKYQRNTDCQNVSASQQLYMTFPPNSTFSEEDVKNYFSNFGCVEDVRIPSQQRRMFGFVTFVDSETVKIILDMGNPHYVCGSHVLVKPYKEKKNHIDRKHSYRIEDSVGYSPPLYVDVDTELNSSSFSTKCTNELMRSLLFYENVLKFERQFAMVLQQSQNSFFSSPPFGINMDVLGGSNDHFNGQPAEALNYLPNVNSLFARADLP